VGAENSVYAPFGLDLGRKPTANIRLWPTRSCTRLSAGGDNLHVIRPPPYDIDLAIAVINAPPGGRSPPTPARHEAPKLPRDAAPRHIGLGIGTWRRRAIPDEWDVGSGSSAPPAMGLWARLGHVVGTTPYRGPSIGSPDTL
jgi:hypothetical protein